MPQINLEQPTDKNLLSLPTADPARQRKLYVYFLSAQILIAFTIITYLFIAYEKNPYQFERAKTVDFIKKTDEVLTKYSKVTGLTEQQLLDSTRVAMAHKLASSNYQSVEVPRFLRDGIIIVNNNKGLVTDIENLTDTSSLSESELVNNKLKLTPGVFKTYNLNQFISGGNFWSPFVYFLIVVFLFDIILLLVTSHKMSLAQDHAERMIARQNANNNPQDIRLSWVSAQTTLDTYYRRNLAQNTWTFILSVIVIIMGFVLIFWGIGKALSGDTTKNSGLVAVLSTSAGVITQLIGGTFLAIYNSTLKQALDYTKNLQKTSTVGTSLSILNSIEIIEQGLTVSDPTTIAGKLVDAKIAIAQQLILQPVG